MRIHLKTKHSTVINVLEKIFRQEGFEKVENMHDADLVLSDDGEGDLLLEYPLSIAALLVHMRAFSQNVCFGDYTLSKRSRMFSHAQRGDIAQLTEKEADLLLYLKNHSDVMKEELLSNLWGYCEGLETHTLETHIYRLRQKIEENPLKPTLLVGGNKGYRLVF